MTVLVGIVFIVLAVVIYSALTEMMNARQRRDVLDRVAENVPVQNSPVQNITVQQLSRAGQLATLILDLPDPQRQQAFQLLCSVNDAVTGGQYRNDARTQFLLEQTLNTYLPDTIRAYLDLTPGAAQRLEGQGQPARQLLTEQLQLMQDGVEQAIRRDHAAADRLLGQGSFLRERFGQAQETEADRLKIR